MKEAVASKAGDHDGGLINSKEARRPWEEEGGILSLKKEANAAWDLWVDKFVPGALDRWLELQRKGKPEEAPGVGKKVVKSKLPKDLIAYMAADPDTVLTDISDEKLATCTPAFRQMYAIAKILEAKTRQCHNALIAQYNERGYAEDEHEVTDDEFEN